MLAHSRGRTICASAFWLLARCRWDNVWSRQRWNRVPFWGRISSAKHARFRKSGSVSSLVIGGGGLNSARNLRDFGLVRIDYFRPSSPFFFSSDKLPPQLLILLFPLSECISALLSFCRFLFLPVYQANARYLKQVNLVLRTLLIVQLWLPDFYRSGMSLF